MEPMEDLKEWATILSATRGFYKSVPLMYPNKERIKMDENFYKREKLKRVTELLSVAKETIQDMADQLKPRTYETGIKTKIAIIGSSGLYPQMREHFMKLHKDGIQGMMVKMDWDGRRIEDIVDTNKKRIQEADEVHLFWDGRSPGTILDLGMAIALNKPLRIIALEEKSIPEYVKKYAVRWYGEKSI